MWKLKYRISAAAALGLVMLAPSGHADLLTISGTIGGELEGDAGETSPSLSVGFGLNQNIAAERGDLDEDGVSADLAHRFDGEAQRLVLSGTTAAARGGNEQAEANLSASVDFTVDEANPYQLTVTKDSEDGETALFSLTQLGSPSNTTLFFYNGQNQPGLITQVVEFDLDPGITYRIGAALSASVPGLSGTDGSGSSYNLTLELVPEPAAAWLLVAGAVAAGRRWRRQG